MISAALREALDSSSLDKSTTVDTFRIVDMRDEVMRLFGTAKVVAVEFCERCSQVCDSGCRQAALSERALVRALRPPGRI